MSVTGETERALRLAAEQQLFRFLRLHLDPTETRDAIALAQNYGRTVRAEERHFARHVKQGEREDCGRREASRKALAQCNCAFCESR